MELAQRAVELTKGEEPQPLDALAAALAETGDFAAALEASRQAAMLAFVRHDESLSKAIDERTKLYHRGTPYREAMRSVPADDTPPFDPPARSGE